MPTSAYAAFGSKIYRKNPSSGLYEQIVQCTVLNAPPTVQNYIDITNHDSPGGRQEKIPGIKTNDTMSMTLYWDPSNITLHAQLYQDYRAQTKLTWKLVAPTATLTSWIFEGFINQFAVPLNYNEAIPLNWGIEVTGDPDFTA